MKLRLQVQSLLSVSFMLLLSLQVGCGFMSKSDGGDDDDDDDDNIAEPTTVNIETTELTPGVVTGKVMGGSTSAQLLSASSTGNISGSSITFPPGALAVDMDFTLEEGVSIASAATAAELGLDSAARAGPAVVIDPASEVSLTGSLAVSVSMDGARLTDDGGTLSILYMIKRQDGFYSGIITGVTLSADGSTLIFDFSPGEAFLRILFQAIRITGTVVEIEPVKSEQEISTVREESEVPGNTAPTLAALVDLPSKTNVPVIKTLAIGDDETDAASLIVTASSSSQPLFADADISIGGSGASRTLTAKPAANFTGSATISVTVSDGALSVTEDFQVTVTGRSWSHPTSLSDNISPNGSNAGYHFEPTVMDHALRVGFEGYARPAVSNNGDVVVSWGQWDASQEFQVFLSERRGGTWTHPANLYSAISPAGYSIGNPDIAIDDSGNAILAWHQYDGTVMSIFKSEYRGASWTHPSGLADHLPSWDSDQSRVLTPSKYPVVAMGGSSAEIAWKKDVMGDFGLFHGSYSGGSWSFPAADGDQISTNISFNDSNEHLVRMNRSGDKLIVWRFDSKLFFSHFTDGSWTHPASDTDHVSFNISAVQGFDAAIADNGDAIITWVEYSATIGYDCLFISEYRAGAWIPPTDESDATCISGYWYDQKLAVDMSANGDTIIAYRGTISRKSTEQLFLSEYRGGTWTHPSAGDVISPPGSGPQVIDVAMSDFGHAVVTWSQWDTSKYQVYMSYYDDDNGWIHPDNLNDHISYGGSVADQPSVSMNSYGDAVIAWYENDGSNNQIFISELK